MSQPLTNEIEPCYACGQPWKEPMMDARDAEDYRALINLTAETYMRITGGLVSKPFTDPTAVAGLVDDRLSELDSTIEELKAELRATRAGWNACHQLLLGEPRFPASGEPQRAKIDP